MSRFAPWLVVVINALVFAAGSTGCTKTAANQESASKPGGSDPVGTKIAVPGGESEAQPVGGKAKGNDGRFRLQPDEGKLAVEAPADVKANAEATAKIIVTPGKEYKVNTEYPTKLTLESTSGVTIAKAELKAGGHTKTKGDADVFEEAQLVFAVKLTPAASGTYTVNGTFKFAVCDKAGSTCLAKKEPIAIQVAAK